MDTIERCEHIDAENPDGRERRRCNAVHFTPRQIEAYVEAVTNHPDARFARKGRPVPTTLL